MYFPSEDQFLKLTAQGNLIPVYGEILADLETPVSAYYKIATKSRYSFLLESIEGEEKIARYSFLACDPEIVFRSQGRNAEIISLHKGERTLQKRTIAETPLTLLREIMAPYRFVETPSLPRFCGGLVGYLSYDCVRFFENLPDNTQDDLQLPDVVLVLAKTLIIFDHINHKIKVVSCAHIDPTATGREKLHAYHTAKIEIEKIISTLQRPLDPSPRPIAIDKNVPFEIKNIRSNFTQREFEKIVREGIKQINRGEIIQVVLSQRFQLELKSDPLDVYRTLRVLNPSPYMYYLNFDDLKIVGSSPELLIRCEDGIVETRPIAGTRPRGKDDATDSALMKELLHDPKEKAEHIMLVDLGRNDLGRVCKKGSVKITDFMKIEKYSHVMHIVSNVQGILKPGKDALDVLQASFPAGTVSGAPKIRAMEIIEDLERVKRGPYAGCVGYLSFSKNLDTCITIRTIVIKDGIAYVQAGAGIVTDSQPAKEYMETTNKAKAQLMAILKAQTES